MAENMAEKIRPRAAFLAALPTLEIYDSDGTDDPVADEARSHGIHFRQELKLERSGCRYWLITHGGSGESCPEFLRRGYVVIEILDQGDEHEMIPYSPDDTAWLQGFDYIDALKSEIEQLRDKQEQGFTAERETQINARVQELNSVIARMNERGPPRP